jgi:thiol-disulfide isomerase/thioredoxin
MVAFLVCLGTLAAMRLPTFRKPGGVTPAAKRRAMGAMTLPEVGGGTWRLADHRGKVVLINYWATWCEPCLEELPALIRVDREAVPKGLDMVGVSLDAGPDAQARVRQYVALFRVPFPVAFRDAREDGAVDLMGLPVTLLVDRQGRVAKTYVGAVEGEEVAGDVATLLAER